MSFLLQVFDELDRPALAVFLRLERCAVARVLQHRKRMQRNVGPAPGVRRGREVIRVGFTGNLEHSHGDRRRHFRARGEPFGVGPALHDCLRVRITVFRLECDVIEEIEHQERFLQAFGGNGADLRIVEQLDQRVHVVAADHRAQELSRFALRDEFHRDVAVCHSSKEAGLDLGGVVDTRRYAVGEQFHQDAAFSGRRRLDEFDEFSHLLRVQRQRRDAERGALCDVLAVVG